MPAQEVQAYSNEEHVFSSEEYVQQFARNIATCHEHGYYFVPFLGAGLSVPSGIPQAAMLTRYLTWCFLRVLGLNPWAEPDGDDKPDKLANPAGTESWTPRRGVWPDMAEDWREGRNKTRKSLSTHKMDLVLRKAIELLEDGKPIRTQDSEDEESDMALSAELVREVYGALADWRTALLLLSRIDVLPCEDAPSATGHSSLKRRKQVVLTAPDHSVVDSFFQFQTNGKQPCLGHRMIAALAPVLRMNVILTPNFDDLVENAFAAINSPLKCFEVPHEVPLPDARLVTRQRSIIKLHGGSFGLRADYSIDEDPDFNDSVKFVSYLAGRPIPSDELRDDPHRKYPYRVAILLCGISGKDQRVLALLRLAQARFENLKVFWFCHSDRDVASVITHFETEKDKVFHKFDENLSLEQKVIPPSAEFITVRHLDYGALLLQIYQHCTNSVPSAGVQFPASWNMASAPQIPPPPHDDGVRKERFNRFEWGLREAVYSVLNNQKPRRPILVPFYQGARGGVALLSRLFWTCSQPPGQKRTVRTPVYPVWLDLDDVATPAGVFLRLALALARRGGISNPISSLSLADFYDENSESFQRVLGDAFRDHHARTGECLLVCINAQEAIGDYSPFIAEDWQRDTKVYRNAIDLVKDFPWFPEDAQLRKTRTEMVINALAKLNEAPANGVQFVMVARQPNDQEAHSDLTDHLAFFFSKMVEATEGSNAPWASFPKHWAGLMKDDWTRGTTTPLTTFKPESAGQAAINWAKESDPRDIVPNLRPAFLRLLMGFRFARFDGGLIRITERLARECSNGPFNSEALAANVRQWLNDLACPSKGAIRWKVGGVIWVDGAVRHYVLAELLNLPKHYYLDPDRILLIESLQARWYGRLLLATSDPMAATESVIHAFQGVHRWLTALASPTFRKNANTAKSLNRLLLMVRHARGVLDTASSVLEEQLSDQFADHTLVLAQASVEAVIDAYKAAKKKEKVLFFHLPLALESCIKACQQDIISLRIALYLQEGEFHTLIRSSTSARDIRSAFGPAEAKLNYKRELANLDVAMARGCFRDYGGCEKAFSEVWVKLVGIDPTTLQTFIPSGSELAREWISNGCQRIGDPAMANPDSDERVRLLCRLSRRHVYLCLLRGLGEWLRPEKNLKGELKAANRRAFLRQAQWIGDFGMEVLRSIPRTNDRFAFDENVRIRAHCALVREILGFHENDIALRTAEFHAALAFLNDGEAFIEEFPIKDGKVGRVVVELRRAEILLVHSGEGQWLADLRKQFDAVSLNSKKPEQTEKDREALKVVEEIRNREFPKEESNRQAALQERIAVVYDAMRYLERCEMELRNHPKNRWWWWIYLVLRVHAVEGLFGLRLMLPEGDSGEPDRIIQPSVINFVKKELEDWINHIGLTDSFQLARIVRSYRRLLAAQKLHLLRLEALPKTRQTIRRGSIESYEDVFTRLCTRLFQSLGGRLLLQRDGRLDRHVFNFAGSCLLDAQDMGMPQHEWHDRDTKLTQKLKELQNHLGDDVYQTIEAIESMKSCTATVVEKSPCSAYFESADGQTFHLGSADPRSEIARFLNTLKVDDQCSLPAKFREHQDSQTPVPMDGLINGY